MRFEKPLCLQMGDFDTEHTTTYIYVLQNCVHLQLQIFRIAATIFQKVDVHQDGRELAGQNKVWTFIHETVCERVQVRARPGRRQMLVYCCPGSNNERPPPTGPHDQQDY